MNNTKIILSIILISTTFQAYPNQQLTHKSLWGKTISAIAQSYPMYWLEKNIQAPLSEKFLSSVMGNKPATPHYQELGKEAQYAVGIPEEYHVPMLYMPPTSPLAAVVGAITFPCAIYVNEEKLDLQTYGVQRCLLFHEAIHKKYNDVSMDAVLEWPILFGTGYATHKLLQIIKPAATPTSIHGILVCVASFYATYKTSMKYHHYFEQRADIEGYYATQCATCVHEAATYRRKKFEEENHPLKNNGYLQANQLTIIALDLQQQNKLCTYHINNA